MAKKRKSSALYKAKDRLRHQVKYYSDKGFAIDATARQLLDSAPTTAGEKTSLVSKIKNFMKNKLAVIGQNPILKGEKTADFIEMTKEEAKRFLKLQKKKKIDPFSKFNKALIADTSFSDWLREREMFQSKDYKDLQNDRLAYNIITAVEKFREPLRSRLLNKFRTMSPAEIVAKAKEIYALKTHTTNTRYDDVINVVFAWYRSVGTDDLSVSYDVNESQIADEWGVDITTPIKRIANPTTTRKKIFGSVDLFSKEEKFAKKWNPTRREKLNGL